MAEWFYYNYNKCQNCGHESHCGVPLMRDERAWTGKLLGQIKVCDKCRCDKCTEDVWR